MQIIPDQQLTIIPIKDNGEKLVYVKDYCPKMVVRIDAYIKKKVALIRKKHA